MFEAYDTDDLVKIIITETGLPLPTYNYNIRAFISMIPENMPNNCGGVTGIDNQDVHETFRDACLRIVYWHYNRK